MILKFSLTFTVEENYWEIGVMKAIEMRDFSIRKIYCLIYPGLVTAGAVTGFFISIPVENVMVESVSKNMVLKDGSDTLALNLLCSRWCLNVYSFHRKTEIISAIEAIRRRKRGAVWPESGLNFHRKNILEPLPFSG